MLDIQKILSQLKNNKGEPLKVRVKDKTLTVLELFENISKGKLNE